MHYLLFLAGLLLFACTANSNIQPEEIKVKLKTELPLENIDSLVKPSQYENIIYDTLIKISSGAGTKSVVFNSNMSKLFAMNLEGMSVYEFDQQSKKIIRSFNFKPTPGFGWDYEKDVAIPSYEEKPVEAIITNGDSILWVSLHNAGGIVPIFLKEGNSNAYVKKDSTDKLIFLQDSNKNIYDSIYAPLIKTGKTPKVLCATSDNKTLLVSNWHSNSISALAIQPKQYPYAKVIATTPVSSIPRGLIINEKTKKTYVAIMGGASIAEIDNNTWRYIKDIPVAANPRHLVQDDSGRIFISFNKISQIACIDPNTGRSLFSAKTAEQPRSIALSKNKKFLFVTCYKGNKVSVYKIKSDGFELVKELDCPGSPVGVDVFENNQKIEVWVCSYEGVISVYSFKKTK